MEQSKKRPSSWGDWRWQLRNRIRTLSELERWIRPTPEERESFELAREKFDFALSPYYASLMDRDDPLCPIRLQAIPRYGEIVFDSTEKEDPLEEESHMPILGVTHRYPDRALWYLSHTCAVYCRFCTRKRKVSKPYATPGNQERKAALEYFRKNEEIREVILSGGDPLSLSENLLDEILGELRAIPHILSIRIHTRHPVTLPMRIQPKLCRILEKYFPITLVTHFNHPKECTEEARIAIRNLRTIGGVLVLNQSVLLRGVNDSVDTLEILNYSLISMGVKPYYLHQCDEVYGVSHFQVPISRGQEMYKALRGRMSGISVPLYVADLKGGGGKVPILPSYLEESKQSTHIYRNYKGELYEISNGEKSLYSSSATS